MNKIISSSDSFFTPLQFLKFLSGNIFLGILLLFLFLSGANAYSGNAGLFLMAEDETLSPGESTQIHIFLDSTDLLMNPSEAVQTLSAYISFPPDSLEVVGAVDFSASSFSTPYVNDIDNNAGSLEIVRARDTSDDLLSLETIGTFEVRVKAGASGDLDIFPVEGMNSVLLNDVTNSDVLGDALGVVISVPDGESPPSVDDGSPVADASIWLSSDKTELAVGESATVQIFMDSGSDSNMVSSADLTFSFPENLLQIEESSVNISSGVLSSATINTVNNADGTIELVLFQNPPASGDNALIGSFTVTRTNSGEALLSLAGISALFSDDVNNTDVLDISASGGILFSDVDEATDENSPADDDTPVDDDSSSDSTDGGGGGGGGGGGNRTNSSGSSHSSAGDEPSTSTLPFCQSADNFSGKQQSDGKIHFSWDQVSDLRVEGFELLWQKDGSGEQESLSIPKISSVNFPEKNLTPGNSYTFRLMSFGEDCESTFSDAVSIRDAEDGQMFPVANNDSSVDPGLYSASTFSTPSGYANMQKNAVAGKSFSSVPGTPNNGPVAIALVLFSFGIGFLFWARRRGK